jgi:hypothetical protein
MHLDCCLLTFPPAEQEQPRGAQGCGAALGPVWRGRQRGSAAVAQGEPTLSPLISKPTMIELD